MVAPLDDPGSSLQKLGRMAEENIPSSPLLRASVVGVQFPLGGQMFRIIQGADGKTIRPSKTARDANSPGGAGSSLHPGG
jgi:hypothetical protein